MLLFIEKVYLGVEARKFSGLCVKHLTDNMGAEVTSPGSPKEDIQEVVLKTFNQCKNLKKWSMLIKVVGRLMRVTLGSISTPSTTS